jgi:hypothetical protein
MFIVCMSLARVLMWVRGRAKQKRSLIFCVFGHTRSKCFSSFTFPKSQLRWNLFAYGMPFHTSNITSSCVLPHQNWANVFHNWAQLMPHKYPLLSYNITLKRKYLVCTLISISRLVNNFSMKTNYILSFTLFTLNIVWGNLGGGGAPTSWLIEFPIIDLTPTGYTSCSAANLTIWAPTHTFCALHQSIWLSAQPFTPARRVGCMCVISGIVLSESWTIPTRSTWVVVSWGAVSNGGWTKGKTLGISWGWF